MVPAQTRTRKRAERRSRVKVKRLPNGTVLRVTVYDKPKRKVK